MSDHEHTDHVIEGSPHERMRRVLARHLCGWMTGHHAPQDRFLADADLILRDAHEQGIRFHLAEHAGSVNIADGFIDVRMSGAAA